MKLFHCVLIIILYEFSETELTHAKLHNFIGHREVVRGKTLGYTMCWPLKCHKSSLLSIEDKIFFLIPIVNDSHKVLQIYSFYINVFTIHILLTYIRSNCLWKMFMKNTTFVTFQHPNPTNKPQSFFSKHVQENA